MVRSGSDHKDGIGNPKRERGLLRVADAECQSLAHASGFLKAIHAGSNWAAHQPLRFIALVGFEYAPGHTSSFALLLINERSRSNLPAIPSCFPACPYQRPFWGTEWPALANCGQFV